ncbi:hypothetical protein PHISCL_07391, partial [Aspergillus sclerotialis]
MTDRFARTDGSTTHECNVTAGLYCGGTWRGTINQLDYIQGMGFDAIMISPVVENIEGRVSYGEAYHGYWPKDLYSLNAHFGTHQDLLDLSGALHKRGMYLMMDTVVNNMAYILNNKSTTDIHYSVFNPFNSEKFFHPYCEITDYEDHPLEQKCWTGDKIVPLPDLKTEDRKVQNMLVKWIKYMISTYSIDGLRIDAAKHITPSFLPSFQNAAGVFMTGEVFEELPDIICKYQDKYIGSVTNYPIYFAMLEAFTRGNTSALTNEIQLMSQLCPDVTALTSFSENHDVSRIASLTKDISPAKNMLTFTLLFDGIPMIYQGQEQHYSGFQPPLNRAALWTSNYTTTSPLYILTRTLNRLRKHIATLDPSYLSTRSYPIYKGGSEIVIRKGTEGRHVIMILSTQGSDSGKYMMTIPMSYGPGTVAMDVLSCVNYTVDSTAQLTFEMESGEPK